jgi:hypothetical protein
MHQYVGEEDKISISQAGLKPGLRHEYMMSSLLLFIFLL